MTNQKMEMRILIGQLPGLEAAKKKIQEQIDEIHRRISEMNVKLPSPVSTDSEKTSPSPDPTILGRDSLGRVIRKRKLSPEVVERKREVMKKVRAERLRKLGEMKWRIAQPEEAGARTNSQKNSQGTQMTEIK